MPLTCVSNDAILKKPAKLDYSNPTRTVPFTLNGAPFANTPESIKDKQETVSYVIPGTPGKAATVNSPAVGATPDSIGYKIADINTVNIIGANSATTLKYENKTYSQKFIAIHKGIWGDSKPYVSILLLSSENDFFHLCIPINLMSGEQDENLFLKYWLHAGVPPSGFTLNQILNFRGPNVDSVDFAIIQYCLKYNSGANTNPYTLCIFNKPLNVNTANLPWISNFTGISKSTFDNVLNYMLNGMFRNNNGRTVSTEQHFGSDSGTVDVPTPSFFIVKSSELVGRALFSQRAEKKLNNIKCYPIDLFNQIDDEGNIFVDEESKKPIDIKSVNDPNADIVKDSAAELQRQQSLNNLSFIVVFSIVFLIICILLIVLAVWFFSGKPAIAGAGAAGAVGAGAGALLSIAKNTPTTGNTGGGNVHLEPTFSPVTPTGALAAAKAKAVAAAAPAPAPAPAPEPSPATLLAAKAELNAKLAARAVERAANAAKGNVVVPNPPVAEPA